jgi:hypothetical protein
MCGSFLCAVYHVPFHGCATNTGFDSKNPLRRGLKCGARHRRRSTLTIMHCAVSDSSQTCPITPTHSEICFFAPTAIVLPISSTSMFLQVISSSTPDKWSVNRTRAHQLNQLLEASVNSRLKVKNIAIHTSCGCVSARASISSSPYVEITASGAKATVYTN